MNLHRFALFPVILFIFSACSDSTSTSTPGQDTDNSPAFSDRQTDNMPPVSDGQSVTVAAGNSLSILLSGTDADGDSLNYYLDSQPGHGSLDGVAPDLTYTPDVGYVGGDDFTYHVNDGQADSAVASIAITVTAQGTYSLSWTKPATLTNNLPLPAGFITGYAIYKDNAGRPEPYQTVDGEDTFSLHGVEGGKYYVAARYDTGVYTGQSALSAPIETQTWRDLLPLPDAANTIDSTMDATARNAIIAANNQPGDVIYFRGGTYNHSGPNAFIALSADGAPGSYITMINYPGEKPILVGNYNTQTNTGDTSQRMIAIRGAYTRVYGITIRKSGRYGITIEAPHAWVEECHITDCFSSGIAGGWLSPGHSNCDYGLIRYCQVERSRTWPNIVLRYGNGDSHTCDHWTIEHCISIRAGFDERNQTNSKSGDGDGIQILKDFHNAHYPGAGNWLDAQNGRQNQCHFATIAYNLILHNADDGFDESAGLGLKVIGNISANNGPEGNQGYKVFTNDIGHFEEVTYLGNIALQQNPNGPPNSSSVGFGLQTNMTLDNRGKPAKHIVHNGAYHNNNGTGGTSRGIARESNPTGDFIGNVSTGSSDPAIGDFNSVDNHLANETEDPEINNFNYTEVSETFVAASSVQERWTAKYHEIRNQLMPVPGGNLYSNVTTNTSYHESNSADDPTAPSAPFSKTKLAWFALDKAGSNKDKGPVQYVPVNPPAFDKPEAGPRLEPSLEDMTDTIIGFGRNVTGGKGAPLCHVTSLAAYGEGSLRACAEQSAAAWIVFDVSGTIGLDEAIDVQSNKTIMKWPF